MAIQFSEQDTGLIKNMMLTKSARSIATLLDCDKTDVEILIAELSLHGGIISYQEKLEARAKLVKIKQITKAQLEQQRRKEEKTNNLLERQRVQMERNKIRTRGPLFKTKQVDYTKLIAVRIDHKTVIYAKPGQDIDKLKEDFLRKYKKSFTNL